MAKTSVGLKTERDYQAEDDFRALERAHEVTTDRTRHAAATRHGKKRLTTLQQVMAGRTLGSKRR